MNQRFRTWVRDKWYEHLDERITFGDKIPDTYTVRAYYNKYKWWLKREYRNQQGKK